MKELNLLLQLPQDVSTRYRSVDMTVLAAFAIRFCLRHCVFLCKGTKVAKSAAFCGCLPVFMEGSFRFFVGLVLVGVLLFFVLYVDRLLGKKIQGTKKQPILK